MALVDGALDIDVLFRVEKVKGAEAEDGDKCHDDGNVGGGEAVARLDHLLGGHFLQLRGGWLQLHGLALQGAGRL